MTAQPAIKPLSAHSSLQERTYQALREAIVGGQFEPGQRLHENNLAELLGVSRNPVREAIRRLQQDGFVEVRPRTGIFVATYSAAEVQDLFRVRAALEGTAAALAAERMSADDIDRLSRVLQRMERAAERHARRATVQEADAFHQSIHEGARSPRLVALLAQLHGQITYYRNVTLGLPGRASQASHGHHDLLEALRRRDPEEADRVMRQHVLGAAAALSGHHALSPEEQTRSDGSSSLAERLR